MEDNLVRKMLSFRWLIFGILAIAYFFVYFHRLSLSVVANDIATDFGTTATVLGMLGSVYFYCYAAMQFPAGLFSDSIGPRKTVAISLLLACMGSILFGLAHNITVAFVARIMVGLGVSMVFIPTMKKGEDVVVLVHYLAKRVGEIQPGEDIREWKWLDINDLPDDVGPNIKPIIEEYLDSN